jgi:hypothetical protein
MLLISGNGVGQALLLNGTVLADCLSRTDGDMPKVGVDYLFWVKQLRHFFTGNTFRLMYCGQQFYV